MFGEEGDSIKDLRWCRSSLNLSDVHHRRRFRGGRQRVELRVAGVAKRCGRRKALSIRRLRARRGLEFVENHPLTLETPAVVSRDLSRRPCPCRGGEVGFGEVLVRVERVVENGDVADHFSAEEAAGRTEFVEGVTSCSWRGLDPLTSWAGGYHTAVSGVAR